MDWAIECVVGSQVIFKKDTEDEGVHNNFRIPLLLSSAARVCAIFVAIVLQPTHDRTMFVTVIGYFIIN